jgi:hypothetical protein
MNGGAGRAGVVRCGAGALYGQACMPGSHSAPVLNAALCGLKRGCARSGPGPVVSSAHLDRTARRHARRVRLRHRVQSTTARSLCAPHPSHPRDPPPTRRHSLPPAACSRPARAHSKRQRSTASMPAPSGLCLQRRLCCGRGRVCEASAGGCECCWRWAGHPFSPASTLALWQVDPCFVGPTVTIASWLQRATKHYNVPVLCSEQVCRRHQAKPAAIAHHAAMLGTSAATGSRCQSLCPCLSCPEGSGLGKLC